MHGACSAATAKRALGCEDGRAALGRPVLALPVDRVRGRRGGHALPPDVAVDEGAVGEDGVALDRAHGVGVGLVARAGRDAEEAGLGVDRAQLAVRRRTSSRRCRRRRSRPSSPASVGSSIARLVLPHALGNAAATCLTAPCGRGELEDEHVLGEPALVARHHRGDAQREALLAEQRVAAVAGAVAPDLARLGVVHDVLGLVVARPGDVVLARPRAARRPCGCTARSRRRRRAARARRRPCGS